MAAASEAVAMGAQMAVTTPVANPMGAQMAVTTAVANPMGAQITVTAPAMGGQMAVAAATPVVVRSLLSDFRLIVCLSSHTPFPHAGNDHHHHGSGEFVQGRG